MELKKVVSGLGGIKARGNLDIQIEGIEKNSKEIKKGYIFIAIKGFSADGHDFVEEAIKNGAIAVMLEEGCNLKKIKIPQNITILMVKDTRKALAICAMNFYEKPSEKMKLIGVTGTKGKTTTTYMIKEILEASGKNVGLIGTIATYINGKKVKENTRTTPDSLELQKIFKQMLDAGVEIVVMEVSSQSLKLDRISGCKFEMGIFTNFSKDHISEKEHENMEDYYNSKLKLFEISKKGIVNADDFYTAKVLKIFPEKEIKTYGIDNYASLTAKDITITNAFVNFKAKVFDRNERIKVGIPGRFSVYNALAAISVAKEFNISTDIIKQALENIKVPGRSEIIENDMDITIMIDYAHSPESLKNILTAVKSYTRGKVICVFGCGGNRDNTKRPIMGKIAGEIADFSVITSDNPRNENPAEIIAQIEEGIKTTKGKYITIEDRKDAIKYAIEKANKKDLVIVAGKGHEPYQEINGKNYPFDEKTIIKDVIEKIKK